MAGLAAAWFLARDGGPSLRVTLLESASSVGGKLRLGEVAGIPVDVGAESLLLRRPEGVALISELGLEGDLTPAVTSSAAIWTRGRLRPIPAGTVMGVPADVHALAASGLLRPRELARVPLDRWLPTTAVDGDVSVGHFVARRLGHAVVDRLVEPLLGGVYAGRADQLSLAATIPQLAKHVRTERSLLDAAAAARTEAPPASGPVFGSLQGGLGRLPPAVVAAVARQGVKVNTGATVRELRRTTSGWSLTVGSTRSPQEVAADAVVLAVPAPAAAKLLRDALPAAASDLAAIPYASVGIVTMAFRRRRSDDSTLGLARGSGFLVPPVDRRVIKAATFTTTKWRWYAETAPDAVLVRASIGRVNEELDLQREDDTLVELARGELADAVGLRATPLDAVVTRWGGGLPQYNVGHLARVARIRAAAASVPGLAVCGAAYDGIGIPACIASGARVTTDLLGQWTHA